MPKEQPISEETIKKIRDFAPKLMELNDEVLFGDIWERPGPPSDDDDIPEDERDTRKGCVPRKGGSVDPLM